MKNKFQRVLDIVGELQILQEEVDNLVEGSSIEANYKAYGRYGFDQLLGNGNPYDDSLQSIACELAGKGEYE